ncbi:nucleotidyltransferase domain-containing protein [Methanospirillum lacunae]|uniref:Polymerase nucleotidyl transferase domain-containing protein n=1 Tax=Methanospirillum lacunae TaxID=668570 RepID=A0A2V2NDK7_9EURY|nr:nucleotidyltransferase domain-containing protein [Methanospirillum lacunae]PWR73681.1 hypothetical protein DK846_00475 [Methanospirillum lacunae]
MNQTFSTIPQSLPSIIQEAINRFTEKIQALFPGKITHIILFGSYARGDYHKDSDVDLLVLTNDDSWELKKSIMDAGFYFYPEIGVMISAKVMTEEQYQKRSGFLFIQEVTREGIPVV